VGVSNSLACSSRRLGTSGSRFRGLERTQLASYVVGAAYNLRRRLRAPAEPGMAAHKS
jgi:hypothetical protein